MSGLAVLGGISLPLAWTSQEEPNESGRVRACDEHTLRLKLLKIAAHVRVTARRTWVRYSSAYPWQNMFAAPWTALRC